MKELVKSIRTAAGMSQEQFAETLGTTPLSINRWENGKTVPNKMAQKQLYDFCVKRGVNLEEIIIEKYTDKGTPQDSGKLILFHGSKSGIVGDIAPISRRECDFGRGFYMGTAPLQPLTLICAEEKPRFYRVELDLTGLKVLNVDIDLDWAMLIAYNRREMESAKGTAIYEKYARYAEGYDVVTGFIANDRMYTELVRFFNRTLTDTALIHCMSALGLGKQVVAVTEKACRQIRILQETALIPLELSILRDMSASRRRKGIALADELELKYRRDGKYFDEILRGE